MIDLHIHLDGAITLDMAKRLAKLQGISLPAENNKEIERLLTVSDNCTSLNDFLKCFELPISLLQTKEAISFAVHSVLENVRRQGIVYCEIRFAPQLHTKKGLSQSEAVEAALDGLKMSDVKANLILCLMRGEGNENENYKTLMTAKDFLVVNGGVVGLDLAGAEALYPTKNYREIFKKAGDMDIPFTIHAGEADGAQSVKLAVEYGAKRIGHGVRIIEDESVLNLVREEGVFLEICPTSNRMTHAVEKMEKYPLADFLNKGIKATINTDDMAIEKTSLKDEFLYMESLLGLTRKQEEILLKNAVDAAFTDEKTKMELSQMIKNFSDFLNAV